MPEERHILALDGLRGVAILLVIVFHTCSWDLSVAGTWAGRSLIHVARWGWTGVDLFFVLSGFLITRILLDARSSTNYFRVFYARRVLRIFPIYYLSLIFFFWIMPLLAHHSSFFYLHRLGVYSAREQLWYWFNLVNFRTAFHPFIVTVATGLWSLSIEEQFYAVWPAIVYYCSPRRLGWVCWSGIAIAFALRQLPAVLAINKAYPNFLYRVTPFRMDSLLIGALLAIFFHERLLTPAKRRRIFRIACIILVIGLPVLLWGIPTSKDAGRYSFTLIAVLYAALLITCLTSTALARIFRFSPLRTMGKYSYCMYVIHPVVADWFGVLLGHLMGGRLLLPNHRLLSYTIESVLGALLCLGIARLSWLLVEQPILRFKKYFRYIATPAAAEQLRVENASMRTS